MKTLLIAIVAATAAFAGDFRTHLVAPTLDVYVSYSSEKPADIPGDTTERNHLVVSVKSSDDSAHAVMVWIMIRLDDQTRTTRTAILPRHQNQLVFRFPLGERRPIELVDIRVDNLRKALTEPLVTAY